MKLLLIVAAAVGLIATVVASKAALGGTLNESVQYYGGLVRGPLFDEDGIERAFYLNGTISRVVYTQKTALEDSIGIAPEVVWTPLIDSIREWLVAQANCRSIVGLNLMPAERH